MRRDDVELDALLSAMRDGPVPLSSADEAEARRQLVLPAVRDAVRAVPARMQRAQRTRVFAFASIGCAAAAAVALALLLRAAREDIAGIEPLRVEPLGAESVTWIDAEGARSALPAGADVSTPGELVAPESSWSRVSTRRGVRVELAPASRLRVTALQARADGAELRLERGEVRCRVPKLPQGQQFSIATPDAQVIVHGTLFSVRFGEPAQPSTCVRVTEGLVEVRHRAGREFLGPGMAWGCAPPAPVATASGPAQPAVATVIARAEPNGHARPTAARSARAARHRGPAPQLQAGTLDEENALLAAALAAERNRDLERARALFSMLLAEYPSSPLVPEARAGLTRSK